MARERVGGRRPRITTGRRIYTRHTLRVWFCGRLLPTWPPDAIRMKAANIGSRPLANTKLAPVAECTGSEWLSGFVHATWSAATHGRLMYSDESLIASCRTRQCQKLVCPFDSYLVEMLRPTPTHCSLCLIRHADRSWSTTEGQREAFFSHVCTQPPNKQVKNPTDHSRRFFLST